LKRFKAKIKILEQNPGTNPGGGFKAGCVPGKILEETLETRKSNPGRGLKAERVPGKITSHFYIFHLCNFS
jgi:hypothetical protein